MFHVYISRMFYLYKQLLMQTFNNKNLHIMYNYIIIILQNKINVLRRFASLGRKWGLKRSDERCKISFFKHRLSRLFLPVWDANWCFFVKNVLPCLVTSLVLVLVSSNAVILAIIFIQIYQLKGSACTCKHNRMETKTSP